MLPFSDSKLKSLAYPVPGMETKKAKVFQAQDGAVYVHTGAVIVKVTNYTKKDDGIYEFATDLENPSYQIVPWFLMQENMTHTIDLHKSLIEQIHYPLAAWYKTRSTNDLLPLSRLSIQSCDTELSMQFEASQGDSRTPDLSLSCSFTHTGPEFSNLYTANGKEFLDMFELIVKLDCETVVLMSSPDHPQHWFAEASTRNNDHTVTMGCGFYTKKQREELQEKQMKTSVLA